MWRIRCAISLWLQSTAWRLEELADRLATESDWRKYGERLYGKTQTANTH